MNSLSLEILTPEKVVLNEEVDSLEIQGEYGRLGILPEHTSLIAKLSFGLLEYQASNKKKTLVCGHGIIEVHENHITVLVDTCEHPDSIDQTRAASAKKRAEERLAKKDTKVDLDRATLALHRAIQRIQHSR